MGNLITIYPINRRLLDLLDKAEQLVRQYSGGYSGLFLSATEFHTALTNSINELKLGDMSQLEKLYNWFLPTSHWDAFVGMDGQDLANEICSLIRKLTKV